MSETKSPRKAYKPRLTIEVTEAQYNALKKHLGYGMQRRIFSILIEDIIDMLDKYGNKFIAALALRQVPYDYYMQSLANASDEVGDSQDGQVSGSKNPLDSGYDRH
jgi:hypothetical protein